MQQYFSEDAKALQKRVQSRSGISDVSAYSDGTSYSPQRPPLSQHVLIGLRQQVYKPSQQKADDACWFLQAAMSCSACAGWTSTDNKF